MYDTTQRRHRDFMRAFRREVQEWNGETEMSTADIIKRVLAGGAPRFYTEYETAARKVGPVLSGRAGEPRSLKGRMWQDMAERVRARRELQPDLSISQAIVDIIDNDEAPSFYLTFKTAHRLYYRCLARRRAERLRRPERRSLF